VRPGRVATLGRVLPPGRSSLVPGAPEPAIAAATHVTERTSEAPRLRIGARLRELWSFREVLANLVRRELKVKYAASFLGAVWSLLNPVVFLAVFSFVVAVLRTDVPDFPVFLLSGLLAWNFFSSSVQLGTRAVVDNASLVKKVAFPREILPLASIGVGLVDLGLQTAVLVGFIAVSGHGLGAAALVLYPVSFVALLAFTTAVTFLAASANVRYRDVQHLVGLGLVVWFWATPIVYPAALVRDHLSPALWNLYLANPMTAIVSGFQRALYGSPSREGAAVLPDVSVVWVLGLAGAAALVSIALLYGAWRLFFRLSGDFAEEL
jgi:ABC-2 type transport system permease protein